VREKMKCSNCGFDNLGSEKYCLNCNQPLVPAKQKSSSSKRASHFFYLILAVFVLGLFALVLYRFVFSGNKGQYIQSLGVDPSSLAFVEFPSEAAQYPEDWPKDLTFPSDFTLVDFSSGKLPEGSKNGWSIKLRYAASPSDAEVAATSFLQSSGWQIVQNEPLDSIGYSIIIQRDQGSGIVIIDTDPEDSSSSLILATYFE